MPVIWRGSFTRGIVAAKTADLSLTGNDDRVFTRYRRQIDHLILLVLLDKNWNFCMDNDFYWNFGMEALEVHSDLEILIISSVSYILCLQKYSDLEVLEVLIMYGSSVTLMSLCGFDKHEIVRIFAGQLFMVVTMAKCGRMVESENHSPQDPPQAHPGCELVQA
ncbi:hypothetical protein Tco_0312535 [Tanacetum coccineum]